MTGENSVQINELLFMVHNLWILIAAALVFIMHLGFACIEAGSVRSKNIVTILFKNTAIMAIGLVAYAAIGFNLMYPGEEFAGTFFGFNGFGIDAGSIGVTSSYNPAYTYWSDFIFQAMFAATAATIVSGAVAERVKHSSFLLFSTVFLCLCYPIVGMWKWGGGFLDTLSPSFYDFAGSTLVHSVGGWAALAGVLVVGPRLNRYHASKLSQGEFNPGNPSLMCIGAFLLWFGWYGFNGGSVLSADPGALSLVFVTTSLGAAGGVLASMILNKLISRYYDLGATLNGALGGLVAITAGADIFTPMNAMIVGALGGILVVLATKILNDLRIDDPVGAIPVHLIAGIWGTLAVGLFSSKASLAQLGSQVIGVLLVGSFSFSFSWVCFIAIRSLLGLRVKQDHEIEGLDYHEHGAEPMFIPTQTPIQEAN